MVLLEEAGGERVTAIVNAIPEHDTDIPDRARSLAELTQAIRRLVALGLVKVVRERGAGWDPIPLDQLAASTELAEVLCWDPATSWWRPRSEEDAFDLIVPKD